MSIDPKTPTPPAFDPNDAKPGVNPNNPFDPNDPRNPNSPHPADPADKPNQDINVPPKERGHEQP